MHEEPDTFIAARRFLVLLYRHVSLALALEGRDGRRNRLVKGSIELAEVIRADRRVGFARQLGNRLTNVAVIVHDLRDREPPAQQVVSVVTGARVDLSIAYLPRAERINQLI